MKYMKRIASVVLAMVMVLAMSMPVMAATISMNASSEYVKGHTYAVYQIFKGDLYGGKLSNIVYGKNYGTEDQKVSESELAELKTSAQANELAVKIMKENGLVGEAIATLDSENSYTATELADGYYLIVDTTNLSDANDANSAYIVEVAGEDLNIDPKADAPSMEKKVQEKNDSTGTTPKWQDGADYDINDTVPFQLEATLPSDETAFDAYESYKVVFHDKMSDGLTFDGVDSVVVKVDGNEVKSGYTVETASDGCTFHVTIDDAKKLGGVKAGSVITVEFSATLNGNAVIGGEGNPNEAQLEYSNNPNSEQTGKTPLDKVVVFTFETIVNKVDQNKKPLTGATFTLYKWVEGEGDATAGAYPSPTGGVAGGHWKAIEVTDVIEGTTFDFKGLDTGIYKLVETGTPAGYNTIDPVDFTIDATYDTKSTDPKLLTLTTNNTGTFTANKENGTLSADIVNHEGTTLPETGGIGTTIFYVVGAALVIGAGVLLVVKKRMSKEQ